jgi:hypothetical protein
MNYPLENLGPEQFQEFCQALLLREHPNVQCFPVAQPDGGRDAVSYVSEQSAGKFIGLSAGIRENIQISTIQ